MNAMKKSFAAILCIVAFSGCTGQQMSVRGNGDSGSVQGNEPRIVAITPQMLASEQQSRTVASLPAELAAYRPETYRIQPGDTLLVTVWDHPELTTPAGSQQQAVSNGRLVQPDGSFFYPYAGKINVSGMSIGQLRDTLASRLSKYLRDPQLDVNVVGYGSRVSVQGAFADTTPQEITTIPLTLAQAIGKARIDPEQADLSGFVLTRDNRNYPIDLDALNRDGKTAPTVYLKPGDQLFLPFNDRKQVYVIGEVMRPQAITFKTTDLSLTQALGRSGGLNPATSKGSAVYVIRGLEDLQQAQTMVYQLDAKSPAAFALGGRFPLRPGDVVWVGPAGVTRWNRFLTQLLPLTGIINNAAAAQYNWDRGAN